MIHEIKLGPEHSASFRLARPKPASQLSSTAVELTMGNVLCLRWRTALEILDQNIDEDASTSAVGELEPEDVETIAQWLESSDIPPPSPLALEVDQKGIEGREGFRIDVIWRSPDRDRRAQPRIRGGLLEHDGHIYRLTAAQYAVLETLQAQRGTSKAEHRRALGSVLVHIGRNDSSVRVTGAISRKPIVAFQRLEPTFRREGDGYRIWPRLPGIEQRSFDEYFVRTPENELDGNTSLRTTDGEKVRTSADETVILDCLREIRAAAQRKYSSREVAKIISKPEEFFRSPGIDISGFSERVLGLGPEIRRPVPKLTEDEGARDWGWGAEAILESLRDDAPDAPPLDLKDPSVRAQLKNSLEQADEDGASYIPHPEGDGFVEITPQLRASIEAADSLAAKSTADGRLERPPREVLQVKDNFEDLLFDVSNEAPPRAFEPAPRPPNLGSAYALTDYQEAGVSWLHGLMNCGMRWKGALLADDMGLGKTLQALAFMDLVSANDPRPHLVVAPLALLNNWEQEASRFFGSAFEPVQSLRASDLPKDDPERAAKRLQAQKLVLISYESLRRAELAFAHVDWGVVVLDEAQKAKDPGTQIARVVRTLKARFRLALTGTPVETSLRELWTIYDWALPGLLGTIRGFADQYMKPLKRADADERIALAEQLHGTIQPVFRRRMKDQVLKHELPEKRWVHHEVALSPAQEDAYRELLERGIATPKERLTLLQGMFLACAHPDYTNEERRGTLVDSSFPKAEKLFEILDAVRERGEKALVFARWRSVQHWLARAIESRYDMDIAQPLNGEITSSEKRQKVIERFSEKDGFNALVLAPRAAGCGLNITAANHVIHYTREWNPALEDQATDRAYRKGQTRDVYVHTLTSTAAGLTTVEQTLARLLEERRRLMGQFVVPMGGYSLTGEDVLAA